MAEGIVTLGIGSAPGKIEHFILLGLESSTAVVLPFVPAPEIAQSAETYLLPIAEQNGIKLLSITGCKNIFPAPMPPVTTWDGFHDLFRLTLPGRAQDHLEGWFLWRERIRNPLTRSNSQYSQVWPMRISGVVWHGDFSRSRGYIQEQTEKLMRTIERNKDFGMAPGTQVTNLSARIEFTGNSSEVSTGETWMWKTHLSFDLDVFRIEPDGLNVT